MKFVKVSTLFLVCGLTLEVFASMLKLIGVHYGMNYRLIESAKAVIEADAKEVTF